MGLYQQAAAVAMKANPDHSENVWLKGALVTLRQTKQADSEFSRPSDSRKEREKKKDRLKREEGLEILKHDELGSTVKKQKLELQHL